jgi:hypothetical protein
MKILLSILSAITLGGATPDIMWIATNSQNTNVNDTTATLPDDYYEIKNNLYDLRSTNGTSELYSDDDLLDILLTSAKTLEQLNDNGEFYGFADLLNETADLFKNRLEKITVDNVNFYDALKTQYQTCMEDFQNRVSINSNNNNILNDYQDYENQLYKAIEKKILQKYATFNTKIASLQNQYLLYSEEYKSLQAEVDGLTANNKVLNAILKVNGQAQDLFITYQTMINDMISYTKNSYNSARWHSDHYKNAWVPIYGFFYVQNFKNAMKDLGNGMQEFAKVAISDPDSEVFKLMKRFEGNVSAYIDDVAEFSGDADGANAYIRENEYDDTINNDMWAPTNIYNILKTSFNGTIWGNVLDFFVSVFASAFEAEKLHDDFENNINNIYKDLTPMMDNIQNENSITYDAFNKIFDNTMQDLIANNQEIASDYVRMKELSDLMEETQENINELSNEKADFDNIVKINYFNFLQANYIGMKTRFNLFSDQTNVTNKKEFDLDNTDISAIEYKRELLFNQIKTLDLSENLESNLTNNNDIIISNLDTILNSIN